MSLLRGLDHVVHAVRDLQAVAAHYETLGFTTTPPALHPWGTGNALVQLDRSFVEILHVAEPGKIVAPDAGEFSFGGYNREFLARREGMSMLVFSTEDTDADLARWRAASLHTYAPFGFSRAATLPDGEQVTVAFSLAFVTHPAMPDAAFFTCRQHHPEHFWKPRYQRHGNGAARMQRVWLQAEDPAACEPFLAALFPEGQVAHEPDGVTLALEYGELAVRTPASLAERFPGQPLPPTDRGPAFAALTLARAPDAAGTGFREAVAGLVVELV